MQTLTVQVTHANALKALHSLAEKHFIKIVDESPDSPALPGASLSLKAFKTWIKVAESQPTLTLKEARSKWAGKRKQLQQLTR